MDKSELSEETMIERIDTQPLRSYLRCIVWKFHPGQSTGCFEWCSAEQREYCDHEVNASERQCQSKYQNANIR